MIAYSTHLPLTDGVLLVQNAQRLEMARKNDEAIFSTSDSRKTP